MHIMYTYMYIYISLLIATEVSTDGISLYFFTAYFDLTIKKN